MLYFGEEEGIPYSKTEILGAVIMSLGILLLLITALADYTIESPVTTMKMNITGFKEVGNYYLIETEIGSLRVDDVKFVNDNNKILEIRTTISSYIDPIFHTKMSDTLETEYYIHGKW